MKKFFNIPTLFFFIIIIISLFTRFLFINQIPVGIGHDEIDFITNSKSVFLRFSDLSGTWNPLSFTTIPNEQPKSELLYLLLAPFIGPLPFSLALAKAPFIIINVLLIIVLYLITRKLVGQKEAVFVGLIAAFNPWFFYFSRTSFEAPVAVFFYLLSLYLLLVWRGWKILFIFIPLTLAFSCYMGTKLIFIPFCAVTFLFVWLNTYKKRFTRQLIILFFLCLALFAYFVFSLSNQPAGRRLSELNTPFSIGVSQAVDHDRKLSISSPLQNLFSNKFSVYFDQSAKNYLSAFSAQLLFIDNSGYGNISLYQHGYFYYPEIIFILAGGYYLFVKKRNTFYLMLFLLLLSPLPAVLSTLGLSFQLRGALLFPLYVIFSGVGFYAVWDWASKISPAWVLKFFLIMVYALGVLHFMYIYFLVMPITNSEGYFFSSRILSRYLNFARPQEQEIVILSPEPRDLFKEYMFYSNIYNGNKIKDFEKIFRSQNYSYRNIKMDACAMPKKINKSSLYIVSTQKPCREADERLSAYFKKSITIAELKDSGSVFNIYNDKICTKYPLPAYISGLKFSDLDIESLSENSLCAKYIVDYSR